VYIDYNEVDEFLERQADKKICNITMALILENIGKLEKALQYWQQLKTEEGCMKTVAILRNKDITNKETIFTYLEWVLEKKPEVGLSLFIQRQRKQENKDSSKHSNSNTSSQPAQQ